VHVIGHQMPCFDPTLLLRGQHAEDFPKMLPPLRV
jgi:hypothetical protein